ncbi:hypothetical protein AAG906_037821 [Vitis piasezkii]
MGEEEEGVGTNRNQYLDALATELDITCWLPEATRSPTPPSGFGGAILRKIWVWGWEFSVDFSRFGSVEFVLRCLNGFSSGVAETGAFGSWKATGMISF